MLKEQAPTTSTSSSAPSPPSPRAAPLSATRWSTRSCGGSCGRSPRRCHRCRQRVRDPPRSGGHREERRRRGIGAVDQRARRAEAHQLDLLQARTGGRRRDAPTGEGGAALPLDVEPAGRWRRVDGSRPPGSPGCSVSTSPRRAWGSPCCRRPRLRRRFRVLVAARRDGCGGRAHHGGGLAAAATRPIHRVVAALAVANYLIALAATAIAPFAMPILSSRRCCRRCSRCPTTRDVDSTGTSLLPSWPASESPRSVRCRMSRDSATSCRSGWSQARGPLHAVHDINGLDHRLDQRDLLDDTSGRRCAPTANSSSRSDPRPERDGAARVTSRVATASGAGSSETSTTAPSSPSLRQRCCSPRRSGCQRTRSRPHRRPRRGRRSAAPRQRRAARLAQGVHPMGCRRVAWHPR